MTSFRHRPYRAGDEVALNAAYNQAFGTNRSLAVWHWKFQPNRRADRIILAEDASRQVVAQYAAVEMHMQYDGQHLQVGQPVDVFCLPVPGARQLQVYLKAARLFFERYGHPDAFPLLAGFPGQRALRLGQLKLGYNDARPLPYFERDQGRRTRRTWGFRVTQTMDPPAVDDLWQQAAHRYPVSTIRDQRWLQRRYLSHPEVTYHYALARKRGDLQAWAIFKTTETEVQWVDFCWDGRNPHALMALDRYAVALAQQTGAGRLSLWLSNDARAAAVLQRLGWLPQANPHLPWLAARAFSPTLNAADFVERLYFTMGDADLA